MDISMDIHGYIHDFIIGYPWIYPWISMDIHGYIHIHRRLLYIHIATKFSRNTAVPERPFPQAFLLWNC